FKTRKKRALDLGLAFEPAHQQRRGLDGREALAARLASELAIARGPVRTQHDAPAFQHPGISPPQRLRLAPAAVEQNDAFDLVERRLLIAKRCALSIEQDDIAAWRQLRRARRAEIEHRPAPGIDGSAEELGETRPGESDLERRAL